MGARKGCREEPDVRRRRNFGPPTRNGSTPPLQGNWPAPSLQQDARRKAKYADDLAMQVTDRKRKGFFNRWRKKKEEVMHLKTAEEEAKIREERRAYKSPIRH